MIKRNEIINAVLFCAAALFLYFFLIPQIPIWSTDEGRYAEIAREMWHLGDYVVPRFNYVNYLEKPILAPALTALTFKLFGDSALGSRLVPICAGLMGLGLTYFFVRKLFSRRIAGFSAITLLTTVGYVLVGRFAVIDMLMTALMSAALFCLMAAYFEKMPKYYLIAYGFMGLSFLTKGLIGIVLPGLIYLCFLIWQKDLKEILRMRLLSGILIVSLIILPWFISISLKEPEFFRVFILEHHFSRFATGSFGRGKPFWFFIPIFFVTAFPWTLFLPAALSEIKKAGSTPTAAKLRFLVCWAGTVLIFFSLPKSKLPYYLLPLSIPTAVLAGYVLSGWCETGSQSRNNSKMISWTIPAFLTICIAAAIVVPVYFTFFDIDPYAALLKSVLLTGSVLLISGSAAVIIFIKKDKKFYAVLMIAAMVYGLLLLAFVGMQRISPLQSTFNEAAMIESKNLMPVDMVAIYAPPDDFSDFPFHLKRRIVIVGNNRGTLTRESKEAEHIEENKEWFFDVDRFVKKFNSSEQRVFVLAATEQYNDLRNHGIKDYTVLSEYAEKFLLMN